MIWRRESHPMGAGRVVHVALPERYDESDERYPLVVCLDPQWIMGTACDTCLNLALAKALPRVLVAGVGWETGAAREIARRRAHDYTPTAAPFPEGVSVPRSGGPVSSGGAPEFLHWLGDEVCPFLDRTYRTEPTDKTLVGHSLSALFALYTLFTHPALFRRYLLASPSIWWDDRVILTFEDTYARANDDLPAQVFISVGADEETTGPFPMVTNARLLHDRLRDRRYPSLRLHFDLFGGENHFSTIPIAVSRGLRTLLGR